MDGCYKRTVQHRGVVTLPKEWRERVGVEEGDELFVRETEDDALEIVAPEN